MLRWPLMLLVLCASLPLMMGCHDDDIGPDDEGIVDGRGFDAPEVEGPYTQEDLQEIYDNFSWNDVEEVQEEDGDGLPLLYYVELLVASEELEEFFDELSVPWDYYPLFESEEFPPKADIEILSAPVISEGFVVYIILPGVAWNAIRDAALEGDDPFGFMRHRAIPKPYRKKDGTLKPQVFREWLAMRDLQRDEDEPEFSAIARIYAENAIGVGYWSDSRLLVTIDKAPVQNE